MRVGMILILLMQALWGASNPISKYLLGMTPPIFLVAVRMLSAGLVLLCLQYFRSHSMRVKRTHLWYYAQIIFFGIYVKYIFRYWGLHHLPVTKMSFLLNVTPFFVAIFSYIFCQEELTQKQWRGLGIGFFGLLPLFTLKTIQEDTVRQFFVISLPELAILIEIAAHSYALIITRRLIRDLGCSSTLTNGVRMFWGGLLALFTSLLLEPMQPLTHPTLFFGWLALLICVSNVICHSMYLHLLKYYSATFLAFTDFLCPVFAALYGCMFFDDVLSWHYFASGFIVFVGLYLFYQDELSANQISVYMPRFWRLGTKS